MEKHLFNLKFAAKDLERQAKRCEKSEREEKSKLKKVTQSMGGVVKSMESAMKSMNLEKVSQLMDRFEKEFENLDVQTQVMDSTMSNTSTLTAPQNEVDQLMMQVADEAGLELNMDLPSARDTALSSASQASSTTQEQELRPQLVPANERTIKTFDCRRRKNMKKNENKCL